MFSYQTRGDKYISSNAWPDRNNYPNQKWSFKGINEPINAVTWQ